MDLTKLRQEIVNMFTNGGKDSQTWPRTVFTSGKNHLCARGLNFQNDRPNFLRLNSTGDITPEEDIRGDSRRTVKKGILGEYTQSRIPVENIFPVESARNLDQMPCQNNRKFCPTQSAYHSAFSGKKSNGFNFNMAQRQYRYPSFGVGCRPIPPRQRFGNAYPYWFHESHGALLGNPFGGNGYPAPFPCMAPFANVHPANHRGLPKQFYRRETQNNQCQEKTKYRKKSPVQEKDEERAKMVQSAITVDSVADTLSELNITSENSSQKDEFQTNEAPKSAPLKMYVTLHNINKDKDMDVKILNSQRKERKEDIPSVQQKLCDNCRKCSNKVDCMDVGYCLLSPANGTGKLTVVLDNKENVRKLSNAKGKNGYHNKESSDSDKLSDEIVPSQNMNDHLHHNNVGTISSSHSSPGAQPKGDEASTPSNSHLVARVILQRNSSSKRKACRKSAKRRQSKNKEPHLTTEMNALPTNKKQKVNHREIDNKVPSTSSGSRSSPCSTIAYILGIGSAKENQVNVESVPSNSNDVAYIHCKVSVKPEKFSFIISSSDDTDFSDDDDDGIVALSEDDADIWNSFSKCDDPYNPMNFLTSTCTSTPKPIPKSNSAPSLLSPEVLQNDDVWKKDTPPFSPPKNEALTRTAKKVRREMSE